jgi:hypothetical protein
MGEDGRAQAGQGLVVAHQVQVVVRLDLEQVQHLVEHLPVLGGDADARFDPGCLRKRVRPEPF